MVLSGNYLTPYMRSLATCLNRIIKDGYSEDFVVKNTSLELVSKRKNYKPSEVHLVNFFKFIGNADPSEKVILYVLETVDGVKGVLLDLLGKGSDSDIPGFIKKIKASH